jgi:peroxiredoxin
LFVKLGLLPEKVNITLNYNLSKGYIYELALTNQYIFMKSILFFLLIICSVQVSAQTYPEGLNVNDVAPDFTGINQIGKKINLKKQLRNGNVVLVFYRGQWCPFCNKQLKQLEDSLALIKGKGATVLAITPELPENISLSIRRTNASYPILYDEGLKIMNAYKVAYKEDDQALKKYRGDGINILEANGNNGANLPVPAVYIINKKGKITYRFFDINYTKRSSVKDILDHL